MIHTAQYCTHGDRTHDPHCAKLDRPISKLDPINSQNEISCTESGQFMCNEEQNFQEYTTCNPNSNLISPNFKTPVASA